MSSGLFATCGLSFIVCKWGKNYGGQGYVWIVGGFEPATGKALTLSTARRRTADFIAFLDSLMTAWPDGDIVLIMDNLSVHKTLDVRLWALAHQRVRFLFQPTYAPWLNLIEPWWKRLRNLALKGRSFSTIQAVTDAIAQATAFWNAHCYPYRWLKPV
ncbi:MAG: IS630 family transposase [Anaerolineae bacterium]|nr:IS630 family transposase [Anaerolineae bacterium]